LPFENLGVHLKSNFQNGNSFGNVKIHSFTLSYTPRSMKCDSWVSLLACTFASPYFGHEPNVRVATNGQSIEARFGHGELVTENVTHTH
jgi:hypothetical protein